MLLAFYLAMAPLSVSPEFSRARLIYQVKPVYPKLAREARIQGTVRLAALINKKGEVEHLRLIYGHPFLVKAAIDAVKQWRYRPMIVSGLPVSMVTNIDVTFSLNASERDPIVHV